MRLGPWSRLAFTSSEEVDSKKGVYRTDYVRPATTGRQLLTLTSISAAAEDLGPVALSLVLGRDSASRVVEARLRLTPGAATAGLARLDVIVMERPVLGGFESSPSLLVVTESGSEAEAHMHALGLAVPIEGPDDQRARLLPLGDDIDAAIRDVVLRLCREEPAPERDLALLAAA